MLDPCFGAKQQIGNKNSFSGKPLNGVLTYIFSGNLHTLPHALWHVVVQIFPASGYIIEVKTSACSGPASPSSQRTSLIELWLCNGPKIFDG